MPIKSPSPDQRISKEKRPSALDARASMYMRQEFQRNPEMRKRWASQKGLAGPVKSINKMDLMGKPSWNDSANMKYARGLWKRANDKAKFELTDEMSRRRSAMKNAALRRMTDNGKKSVLDLAKNKKK